MTKENFVAALQGSEVVVPWCTGHCPAAPGKAGRCLLGQVTRGDGDEGLSLPRAEGHLQISNVERRAGVVKME